jgi:hypothetical protein
MKQDSLLDKLAVSILTLLLINLIGLTLFSWYKVFTTQEPKQEQQTTKDVGHFMDKTPYEKEYKHTYTNKRNRVK